MLFEQRSEIELATNYAVTRNVMQGLPENFKKNISSPKEEANVGFRSCERDARTLALAPTALSLHRVSFQECGTLRFIRRSRHLTS